MAQPSNFTFCNPNAPLSYPCIYADKSSFVQIGTETTWKFDTTGNNNWKETTTGGLCNGTNTDAVVGAIKQDGTLWVWGCNYQGQLNDSSNTSRSSPVQTSLGGSTWKQISTGYSVGGGSNSCASNFVGLKTDGTLWAWGCGSYGQLGNCCTCCTIIIATQIGSDTNWCDSTMGHGFGAAIKTDGTLWVWGQNSCGALGTGDLVNRSSPVQTAAGGTTWKMVCAKGRFQASSACGDAAAIKTDGTLWVWGGGGPSGILGTGTTIAISSPSQTVAGGTTWKQVSIGSGGNMAAVKTDGTLWTWGSNACGQLGITGSCVSSPIQVGSDTTWKQVSFGNSHIMAVKTDGTLWAWGCNTCGELGITDLASKSSPVQVVYPNKCWCQVAIGRCNSIAIASDGTAWTAGYSPDLGTNQTQDLLDTSRPQISTTDFSDAFVCADCFSQGGLWVWGASAKAALGQGKPADVSSPIQTLAGGVNWKQVSMSKNAGGAGIKTDGTLWAWGDNTAGQLGTNNISGASSPVQTVATGNNWVSVSFGCCAISGIKTDGSLWIWGSNIAGLLGAGSTLNASSPIQTIAQGNNWKQVSVGTNLAAAIKTDGTLWTWGSGAAGGLGNNTASATTLNVSSPVQTIAGGNNWKQVAASVSNVLAIKTDGTLWGWGCNSNGARVAGVLGNGSTIDVSSPVQIGTDNTWKQVSLYYGIASAVKTDGSLWVWGYNKGMSLGSASTLAAVCSPVQIFGGGNNWKCVSVGYAGKCMWASGAIKTDGTLWTWGVDGTGVLGNNNTGDVGHSFSSPVQTIKGGSNWLQVSVGNTNMGAVTINC